MDKIEREEYRKKLIEDRKKHEIEKLNKVYPPQMESIGERIKIVRKDNKKNQKDFAEELGISQSHISNIEKGADKPSLTLIKLICLKYSVDERWLISNVGTKYMYDNWGVSDELAKNKYIHFKHICDTLINEKSGDTLLKCIDSLCFFYGLLRAYKLTDEDETEFINCIYEMIDHLEKLQYLSTSLDMLSKKISYDRLFHYNQSAEEHIKCINNAIRKAMNIYLKQYNLPCDYHL